MNRREILKYTALATGSAICAPLLSTFISGCTTKSRESDYVFQFFGDNEIDLLKVIIDTILPKTDSPSATDLNIHEVIDEMIALVYLKKDREDYRTGFDSLQAYLNELDFLESDELQRKDILMALENASPMEAGASLQAYFHLKQQTIAYYLNTEEIGKKFLNYLPVPGEYQACISMSETNGKAWHYEY